MGVCELMGKGVRPPPPLPVNEAFSGRETIPPLFPKQRGTPRGFVGATRGLVKFPPSSVRDLGLGWSFRKEFCFGLGGWVGWSASRPLKFAIPFSLGVCHAREEVTNLVHFEQSTDVQ